MKNKNIDLALTAGTLNASALPSPDAGTPSAGFPVLTLPTDPKVREVLENGGFLFLGRNRRGQDEYEYVRMSRAGKSLTGAEAANPPRYKVTAWGQLACFCSCPYRTQPGAPDKHVQALSWWLTQKGAS